MSGWQLPSLRPLASGTTCNRPKSPGFLQGRQRSTTASSIRRVANGSPRSTATVQTYDESTDAVELAEFARAGQVPVPGVRPTRDGKLIEGDCAGSRCPCGSTSTMPKPPKAGLAGGQWSAVGAVLGRLQRHLAAHPAAASKVRPATGVSDIQRSRAALRSADLRVQPTRRRSALSRPGRWMQPGNGGHCWTRPLPSCRDLPDLTVQIVHGDLAVSEPAPARRRGRCRHRLPAADPTRRFVGDRPDRLRSQDRPPRRPMGHRSPRAPRRVPGRGIPSVRRGDLLSTRRRRAAPTCCPRPTPSPYHWTTPMQSTASLETYAQARHQAALLLMNRLDVLALTISTNSHHPTPARTGPRTAGSRSFGRLWVGWGWQDGGVWMRVRAVGLVAAEGCRSRLGLIGSRESSSPRRSSTTVDGRSRCTCRRIRPRQSCSPVTVS